MGDKSYPLITLTKQVDNPFIVRSEEPDGVFEQEHKRSIDDSISEFIGIDLKERRPAWAHNQPVHLQSLQSELQSKGDKKTTDWHSYQTIFIILNQDVNTVNTLSLITNPDSFNTEINIMFVH